MSDDRSIEIVRGLFDALGRGDIETVVSYCDPVDWGYALRA